MIPVMSRCEVTMKSISMVGQWDVPGHLLPLIHLTITLTAYNMGVYIYTLHVCIIFLYMSHTHRHTHTIRIYACVYIISQRKKNLVIPFQSRAATEAHVLTNRWQTHLHNREDQGFVLWTKAISGTPRFQLVQSHHWREPSQLRSVVLCFFIFPNANGRISIYSKKL